MARPRKSLSPEQKSVKKERAEADKAQALASNALAKLPAEKEKRDELWQELEACKSASATAAGEMSAHKKRMNEVFGITKPAIKIRAILDACKAGEYEATVQQITLFMKDTNRPFQLSMPLEPGKGVQEDEGSVFDRTRSGGTVSAERGDDPGRARRAQSAPPPAPTPSPAIALSEFREKLEANKAAGDAKRAGAAGGPGKPPPAPTAKKDEFEDGKDVRSPELVAKEKEREEAAAAEIERAKNMTPAEKRAEAKRIKEELAAKVKPQGNAGLGPDGYH